MSSWIDEFGRRRNLIALAPLRAHTIRRSGLPRIHGRLSFGDFTREWGYDVAWQTPFLWMFANAGQIPVMANPRPFGQNESIRRRWAREFECNFLAGAGDD